MPDKYRSRPVEIEAIQWHGTPEAATPIINWVLESGGTARYYEPREARLGIISGNPYPAEPEKIAIDTLEGPITASPGDWIIRGTEGEFYPCKPSVFDRKYEPAPVGVDAG